MCTTDNENVGLSPMILLLIGFEHNDSKVAGELMIGGSRSNEITETFCEVLRNYEFLED